MANNETIEYIRSELRHYCSPELVNDGEKAWSSIRDIAISNPVKPSDVYYDVPGSKFFFCIGSTSLNITVCVPRNEFTRDKDREISVLYTRDGERFSVTFYLGQMGESGRAVAKSIFNGFIEGQDGK